MWTTLNPTKLLPKLHERKIWIPPGCTFNQDNVEDVILLSQECVHTMDSEHTKAGDQFQFLEWQIYEMLVPVFGVVDIKTGKRYYRKVVFYVPRKNGKSGLMSVIMIYMLGFDGEARPMMYSIAKNKKQAGIVWEETALMIEKSPYLKSRFNVYKSMNDKRILCPSNDGLYTVLSHDSEDKDGLNASCVSGDEIQAYNLNDEQVVKLLHTSTSTRSQPLEFYFGTMGVDEADPPFWMKQLAEAEAVLDKPQHNPTRVYPLLYRAPKDADIFNEETWKIANPSLGPVKTLEYMRGEAEAARLYPSNESEFKRLDLNIITASGESWIDLDVWRGAKIATSWEAMLGRPMHLGVDFASVRDFCALVGVFPPYELDPHWTIIPKFYIPRNRMLTREKVEKKPYGQWEREGHFIATEGRTTDHEQIFEWIVELAFLYKLLGIAFDATFLSTFQASLARVAQKMYPRDEVKQEFWTRERTPEEALLVSWDQKYRGMNEPTKQFEKFTYDGKLKHDGNPIMDWMIDSVILTRNNEEGVKPDKRKSKNKIDGPVAGIMGLGLGLIQSQKKSLDEHIASNDWSF